MGEKPMALVLIIGRTTTPPQPVTNATKTAHSKIQIHAESGETWMVISDPETDDAIGRLAVGDLVAISGSILVGRATPAAGGLWCRAIGILPLRPRSPVSLARHAANGASAAASVRS
jgi:hypothetical protein